jgi:hypothetical protein
MCSRVLSHSSPLEPAAKTTARKQALDPVQRESRSRRFGAFLGLQVLTNIGHKLLAHNACDRTTRRYGVVLTERVVIRSAARAKRSRRIHGNRLMLVVLALLLPLVATPAQSTLDRLLGRPSVVVWVEFAV